MIAPGDLLVDRKVTLANGRGTRNAWKASPTAPADATLIFSHFDTFHLTVPLEAEKARENEPSGLFIWLIWVF